jgi:hypothetical protein
VKTLFRIGVSDEEMLEAKPNSDADTKNPKWTKGNVFEL